MGINSSSSLQGRRSAQPPQSFSWMVLLVHSLIVYLYMSDYWAYYIILYYNSSIEHHNSSSKHHSSSSEQQSNVSKYTSVVVVNNIVNATQLF